MACSSCETSECPAPPSCGLRQILWWVASRLPDAPWKGQWQWPAGATVRRVFLHGRDGFLRAQILRPPWKEIFLHSLLPDLAPRARLQSCELLLDRFSVSVRCEPDV